MLNVVYKIIYNLIFIPLFYLSLWLAAVFNRKIRKGMLGRFGLAARIRSLKKEWGASPVGILHCASLGEFEHIKPFLLELKKVKPEVKLVVLFFSPSGYEHSKSFPAVDAFLYSPHEWICSMWKFMNNLKPYFWIIAKYDVWPNQVWSARWLKIPVFLINASLRDRSSRLLWFTIPFNRTVYNDFTKILTVSENDSRNFTKLVDQEKLAMVGDTNFDQVLYRRDESLKLKIVPEHLLKDRWVFVAGSTWPEDHFHLLPAMQKLRKKYRQILCIICPHEPTDAHIQELMQKLQSYGIRMLSDIQDYQGEPYIIIDRIGVLANIYALAKVAYVGGSFKQNIHNVLEPAVYKIPVVFGPVNHTSHEAQLMKAGMGGIEIRNSVQMERIIEKFLINDIYRQEAGLRAFQVVEENLGATVKTIQIIAAFINSEQKK